MTKKRAVSTLALVRAVLLLPFMVLVVIPCFLLWLVQGPHMDWGLGNPQRWVLLACAILLVAYGLWMAVRTGRLFVQVGRGTPAPWDPPQSLVIAGPYRFVRNPMMSAVFAMLIAESLLLGSWALVAWTLIFIVGNAFYIPLSEEPALEERFGEPYCEYTRHVPRWLPRLTPWSP